MAPSFYRGAFATVPPKPSAAPTPLYTTQLSPEEEQQFQGWASANKVPWQDTPNADYDMRGYWKAQQSGDPYARTAVNPDDHLPHYPDTYKTPLHRSFSNESQYAGPGTPHWEGNSLVPTNPPAINSLPNPKNALLRLGQK